MLFEVKAWKINILRATEQQQLQTMSKQTAFTDSVKLCCSQNHCSSSSWALQSFSVSLCRRFHFVFLLHHNLCPSFCYQTSRCPQVILLAILSPLQGSNSFMRFFHHSNFQQQSNTAGGNESSVVSEVLVLLCFLLEPLSASCMQAIIVTASPALGGSH